MAEEVSFPDVWFCGEDKTLQFDITDENDDPFSLTGKTLVWVLQRGDSSPTALVRKQDEIDVDPVLTNRCTVEVRRADTLELRPGNYFMALAITDPDNFAVLSYGVVTLRKALVTDPA